MLGGTLCGWKMIVPCLVGKALVIGSTRIYALSVCLSACWGSAAFTFWVPVLRAARVYVLTVPPGERVRKE